MSFKTKKVRARDIVEGDRMSIGEKVYRVTHNLPGYMGYSRRTINLMKLDSEYPEDRCSVLVASHEKFRILRSKTP